MRRKTEGPELW